MHKIFVTGHIGADADFKQPSENEVFIHFNLAHTKKWKDKQTNEDKEVTTWYSVFKRYKTVPEKLLNHLRKGNKVLIMGEPSYKIDSYGQGQKVAISINASELHILTFDNSPGE